MDWETRASLASRQGGGEETLWSRRDFRWRDAGPCNAGKASPQCTPGVPPCPFFPPLAPRCAPTGSCPRRLQLEEVGSREVSLPFSPPRDARDGSFHVETYGPRTSPSSGMGGIRVCKPGDWGRRGRRKVVRSRWGCGEVRAPRRPVASAARCHGARWSWGSGGVGGRRKRCSRPESPPNQPQSCMCLVPGLVFAKPDRW